MAGLKVLTMKELKEMGMTPVTIRHRESGVVEKVHIDFKQLINTAEWAVQKFFRNGPTYMLTKFVRRILWTTQVPTACTDGIRIYFNPIFAWKLFHLGDLEIERKLDNGQLTLEDTDKILEENARCFLFVLVHEVYHQLYQHIDQTKNKANVVTRADWKRANYAQDAEINRDIEHQFPFYAGCTKRSAGIYLDEFKIEGWGKIYDILTERKDNLQPPQMPPMNNPNTPQEGEDGEGSDGDDQQGGQSGAGQEGSDGQQGGGSSSGQQGGSQGGSQGGQSGGSQGGSQQGGGNQQGTHQDQDDDNVIDVDDSNPYDNDNGPKEGDAMPDDVIDKMREQQKKNQQGQNGQQGGNQNGQQGQGGGSGDSEGDSQGSGKSGEGEDGDGQGGGQQGEGDDGQGGDEGVTVEIGDVWSGDDQISQQEGMEISENEEQPYTPDEMNETPAKHAANAMKPFKDQINSIGSGDFSMERKLRDIQRSLYPQPVVNWKSALRRHFVNAGSKDVRLVIKKKLIPTERIDKYMPQKEREFETNKSADILYLLDSSGSIGDEVLKRCFTEIIALERDKRYNIEKSAMTYFGTNIRPDRVRMWTTKTPISAICKMMTYDEHNDAGGGTDVVNAIEEGIKLPKKYFSRKDPETLLVVFTDGYTSWRELKEMKGTMKRKTIFIILNSESEGERIAQEIIDCGVPKNNIIKIDRKYFER